MPTKTLYELREDILARLKELSRIDFPKYRTYKRPDGTWVEYEMTPEYKEQERLIKKFNEIQEVEHYFFGKRKNELSIALEQWAIELWVLGEPMSPQTYEIQSRIAYVVYTNTPAVQLYNYFKRR